MKYKDKKLESYINNLSSLTNKKIIVTGATSGIGLALSKLILKKNGKLIMAVRNLEKADKVKQELLKQYKCCEISIEYLDQSKFDSIDNFVTSIFKNYPDFDSIILNAGVLNAKRGKYLENGFPIVSGTNLFGTSYLISKLVQIKQDKHKIIVQGSLTSRIGKYKNFDNDFLNSNKGKFHQYNLSKVGLYNILIHYQNLNLEHYSFHWCEPGVSGTDIIRNFPSLFKLLGNLFLKTFCQNNIQASLSALYLTCENVNNGESYIPDGILAISGLPKRYKYNSKVIYNGLDNKILNAISDNKKLAN